LKLILKTGFDKNLINVDVEKLKIDKEIYFEHNILIKSSQNKFTSIKAKF